MATIPGQMIRSKRPRKTAQQKKIIKQSTRKTKAELAEELAEAKRGTGKRGPGKATTAAREAIGKFVDGNAHRLQAWLDRIAEGVPPKLDARKKPIPGTGIPPDPVKASQLFIQVIEYHVPKLARTEHAGDKENPVHIVMSDTDADL